MRSITSEPSAGGGRFPLLCTLIVIAVSTAILFVLPQTQNIYSASLVVSLASLGTMVQLSSRLVRQTLGLASGLSPLALVLLTKNQFLLSSFFSFLVSGAIIAYLSLYLGRKRATEGEVTWRLPLFLFYLTAGLLPLVGLVWGIMQNGNGYVGLLLVPVFLVLGWYLRFPESMKFFGSVIATTVVLGLAFSFYSLGLTVIGELSIMAVYAAMYMRMLFTSNLNFRIHTARTGG